MNQVVAGRPASIAQAFLQACERAPDKTCVVFEGRPLTYSALAHIARRWSGALRTWGLQPGDRVALFLENGPDFLTAYLGTHLAGGVVVLVNTQYRQVELRHILSDSGARLCIADSGGCGELARVTHELPDLEAMVVVDGVLTAEPPEAAGLQDSPAGAPRARSASGPRWVDAESFLAAGAESVGSGTVASELPAPDTLALLAYTSGTTGRAKGAMLTHGNLAANSLAVTTAWRWTADDVLLLALPLFHVHGLAVGMHGTWLTGSAVELHRRFDAAAIYGRLLQGGVTMFFGVPTMYTRLIAEAERRRETSGIRPPPLRLYVSGSAPLNVQTFQDFERLFGQRILERYGMSETIMNLTNPYDPNDGERRPGTVGQPFPGQEARIVDVQTRQPILDQRPGEIQVRGPHVFQGYWNRPDATAEAFGVDGWFNTGDLGWRSDDGYYTISGRAKELIITGGYNVYPREVEEVLLTHAGVAEAAVVGLPDPEFGEQVVAAVVRQPATSEAGTGVPDTNADDLTALCRDQLAGYKKPRRVVFLDSLPRNALGKVQKHVLQQWLEARDARDPGDSSGVSG